MAVNKHTKSFNKITKQTVYRISQDLNGWRNALNYAESVQFPNRYNLYRLYKDLVNDMMFDGCVQNKKARILQQDYKIVDTAGKENKKATELFKQNWFKQFVDIYIDTIFWGHSLIAIDNWGDNTIGSISLIDRNYVVPEFKQIKDTPFSNTFVESYEPWLEDGSCIEICKNERDLGLLSRLAPSILYKKNTKMFWAEYQETIGFPIMVLKTGQNDVDEDRRLTEFLTNINKHSCAIIGLQDDIQFVQANSSDAYQTYNAFILVCDNEISIATLGATEIVTGGSGGSEARAKVHEQQAELKLLADLQGLEIFINTGLIPQLRKLGLINSLDVQFQWQNKPNLNELADLYVKVNSLDAFDEAYLEEIFNIKLKRLNATV